MIRIKRKWWILFAMSLALAVLFLDQTAVSIALPTMQKDLNANNTDIQWIINAYLLTTACALILGGKLGDIFGHKRIFIIGMIVFIISSATTALAQIEMEAIISRALQGIGGALMIPASNIIIFTAFEDKERGGAMGIQVAIASIFLSLGPLVGGYLTSMLSWRWIFWINLPIGILAAMFVQYAARRDRPDERHTNIDWPGFWVSTLALFCIVFALMQTAEWGWGDRKNLLLFLAGFLAIGLFIKLQHRHEHPLVDLNLFKDKGFTYGSLILLIIQTNFIARIFAAIFFQVVLGFTVTKAGIYSLPGTIPILFAGPIGGYLRDNYGPRLPVFIGSVLISVSSIWIAGFAWTFNYWSMLPGFVAFAFGAPMVISTARTAALSTIPEKDRGAATGVCNAARNVGGTLGLAMMSTIIINCDKLHLTSHLAKMGLPFNQLTGDDLSGLLAGTTTTSDRIAHFNAEQIQTLHEVARHAYTFGFSVSMFVIGAIGLLGVYFALKLPKH